MTRPPAIRSHLGRGVLLTLLAAALLGALPAAGALGEFAAQRATPQFVVSGTLLTPSDETVASQPAGSLPDSMFGSALALSSDGTTALIGGPGDSASANDGGAAWVYARSGTAWKEQAKLTVADIAVGGAFGSAVALSADGNTAFVGGIGGPKLVPGVGISILPGAVWVFVRTGTTWTQQAKLTPSNPGAAPFAPANLAVSSDASTLLAGSPPDDDHAGRPAERGSSYARARLGASRAASSPA